MSPPGLGSAAAMPGAAAEFSCGPVSLPDRSTPRRRTRAGSAGWTRYLRWGPVAGRPTRREHGALMPVTTPGTPRTAIVTVDDDPGVSRAVARDLRRKYGQEHRIVR